jgi:ATP/ADP translocase
LIGVAILGTVAGAFRVAGVASMFLANLMLIIGVWIVITIEVWCSNWIRRTGRYFGAVILSTVLISGTASVGLALTIANLKKQQMVETPVPAPPRTTGPANTHGDKSPANTGDGNTFK